MPDDVTRQDGAASDATPRWRDPEIVVMDRLSPLTASLTWRDSTSGCYYDQIWRIGIARKHGVCPLTGRPVHLGDAVFRPIHSMVRPSNADAMIHADAIDALKPCER
ncbi:DUF3331 domain-containing protein [Pararobbsia silviterrae]|nr:DUF3331 domain-containing protein [Pararobbsia silviterrae]